MHKISFASTLKCLLATFHAQNVFASNCVKVLSQFYEVAKCLNNNNNNNSELYVRFIVQRPYRGRQGVLTPFDA